MHYDFCGKSAGQIGQNKSLECTKPKSDEPYATSRTKDSDLFESVLDRGHGADIGTTMILTWVRTGLWCVGRRGPSARAPILEMTGSKKFLQTIGGMSAPAGGLPEVVLPPLPPPSPVRRCLSGLRDGPLGQILPFSVASSFTVLARDGLCLGPVTVFCELYS